MQPVPQVTDQEVERLILREFGSERAQQASAILHRYGTESWHREIPRVRLAILKLAGGTLEVLQKQTDVAREDHRDVLAYAEYPSYFHSVLDILPVPDEERKRITLADRQQYQDWLAGE